MFLSTTRVFDAIIYFFIYFSLMSQSKQYEMVMKSPITRVNMYSVRTARMRWQWTIHLHFIEPKFET